MHHYRLPSLTLTIVTFLIAGPILWAFPFLLIGTYWPDLYVSSSPRTINLFTPVMSIFAWAVAAVQPKLWPITILPTVAAPILLWLVARRLSLKTFRSRLTWALLIAVVAALVSGGIFFLFALVGLLFYRSPGESDLASGLLAWALVVTLTGMPIGAVLGLLSRAAPNNSFKPNPLRGSA